jgi:hypothetical protein
VQLLSNTADIFIITSQILDLREFDILLILICCCVHKDYIWKGFKHCFSKILCCIIVSIIVSKY